MSFFGSLFGSDQAKDLSRANQQANSALDSAYNASNNYYGQAASAYAPYQQTGQQANTFYANALGLNGDAARTSAENTITSDPLWSGKFALDSNNVLKSMNARGLNASGAAALAGQRVLTEDYQNALGQYASLGAQGLSAANGQAGVYQNQAGNASSYGTAKAGNAINYGNALAANENTGINNILGIIGAATGGYNALFNKGGSYLR